MIMFRSIWNIFNFCLFDLIANFTIMMHANDFIHLVRFPIPCFILLRTSYQPFTVNILQRGTLFEAKKGGIRKEKNPQQDSS